MTRPSAKQIAREFKEGHMIEIMVVKGVEGPSLYINNYRVAGPKPWGGGPAIMTWKIENERLEKDLQEAMKQPKQR